MLVPPRAVSCSLCAVSGVSQTASVVEQQVNEPPPVRAWSVHRNHAEYVAAAGLLRRGGTAARGRGGTRGG